MTEIRRSVFALLILCTASGCVSTRGNLPEPPRGTPTAQVTTGELHYLQAHGNSLTTSSIAAARAAWRTQVRELCGAAEHDEERVYEYTYEVLASDPRERVIAVREGYVRCRVPR